MNFAGLTLDQAAALIGKPVGEITVPLRRMGYVFDYDAPRRIRYPRSATDIQDEITDRIASRPPAAPCFRCGVREGCKHR